MKDPFKALKGMIGDVLLSFINEAQDRQSGRPAEHPNQVKREKRRQDIEKRREQRKEESREREQARREQNRIPEQKGLGELPKPVAIQDNLFLHPAMRKEDAPKPVVVEKGERRGQLDDGLGLLAFGKNVNIWVVYQQQDGGTLLINPTGTTDCLYIRKGVLVSVVSVGGGLPPPNPCAALGETGATVPTDLIIQLVSKVN